MNEDEKGYRKLEIFQRSKELATKIHTMTLSLPKFEGREEGSQIRRSSKSIVSNIVESYCLRKNKNEFLQYLNRSYASCEETIQHLEMLFSTGSLAEKNLYENLHSEYIILSKQIFRFVQAVGQQHERPFYVREIEPEYSSDESNDSNFLSSISNPNTKHQSPIPNPRSGIAVVLVSGGMDSCVTAAIAAQQYELAFLHLNYGQRTERRELKAFQAIADFYGVRQRLVVNIDHLRQIGGSSLTDKSMEVPLADLHRQDVPTSYVPFRNAHILSIAVSWGEVLGATKIFIGAVEEDSSGYPDCRRAYYEAFNRLIELGTRRGTHIEIVTPVIEMKKSKIVRLGIELGAPFHLTWSCYLREDMACGKCDSCALRLRGFREAGIEDPIPYAEKLPMN